MTLNDGLAAALMELFPAVQRDRWPFTPEQGAAAILRYPAFREALTAALEAAIDDYDIPNKAMSYREAKRAVAAAIVDRLLPPTATSVAIPATDPEHAGEHE